MESTAQAHATPARTETLLERAVRRELERLERTEPQELGRAAVTGNLGRFPPRDGRRWAGSPKD